MENKWRNQIQTQKNCLFFSALNLSFFSILQCARMRAKGQERFKINFVATFLYETIEYLSDQRKTYLNKIHITTKPNAFFFLLKPIRMQKTTTTKQNVLSFRKKDIVRFSFAIVRKRTLKLIRFQIVFIRLNKKKPSRKLQKKK